MFGKILRIDPLGDNSANGQCGIPVDNPCVGVDGAAEEVYAIGLRNPWRIAVDPKDGVLHAVDVRELNVEEEEVDVIVSVRDFSTRELGSGTGTASRTYDASRKAATRSRVEKSSSPSQSPLALSPLA